MKIYKITHALPMNEIPIEQGGRGIDLDLTPEIAQQLTKQYGLKEMLGEGEFGVAFLTQDDKVLKLTMDASEAKASQIRQNMPAYAPFAQIYAVQNAKELTNANNTSSYFVIVKEKTTPLNEEEVNDFMNALDNLQDNEQDNEYIDYINDVANYSFKDTMSPENVGRDKYNNLVAFDFRL